MVLIFLSLILSLCPFRAFNLRLCWTKRFSSNGNTFFFSKKEREAPLPIRKHIRGQSTTTQQTTTIILPTYQTIENINYDTVVKIFCVWKRYENDVIIIKILPTVRNFAFFAHGRMREEFLKVSTHLSIY